MQNKMTNKKRICLIVSLVTVLFAALILALTLPKVGYADGNGAGNFDENGVNHPDVVLTMDVNGIDAKYNQTLYYDNNVDIAAYVGETNRVDDIASNNVKKLRKRYLSASAVIAKYINARDAMDERGNVNGSNYMSYTFKSGSIQNSSTAISVEIDSAGMLVVEAKRLTDSQAHALFTVQMKAGQNVITVAFQVDVTDTFVVRDPTYGFTGIEAGGSLMIGYKLNADDTENTDRAPAEWEEGKHYANSLEGFSEIENNSTVTINLADVLVDRAFYCNLEGANNSDYRTPVIQGGSVGHFWAIKSASNFQLLSVRVPFLTTQPDADILNPTTSNRSDPLLTFTLNVTDADIARYNGPNGEYGSTTDRVLSFWQDTHYIVVKFQLMDNASAQYEVRIPIHILPRSPIVKTIPSSYLTLNATSNYAFDISTKRYYDAVTMTPLDVHSVDTASGFGTVIIHASDIIEFSYPESYGAPLCFVPVDSTDTSKYNIEIPDSERDKTKPQSLIVRVFANGNHTVTFTIEYYTSPQARETVSVALEFQGYGKYDIAMPALEGQRAKSYNILTFDRFSPLVGDGFILTAAEVVEDYRSNMSVVLSNNVLTLSPNTENLKGKEEAGQLRLTFTKTNGQKIVLLTNVFNIDIKKGSFWDRFNDWQGGLIIAGAVLAGIILILLIVWLFIRAVSKRRQDDNATQAPVSSYIVKLNASIAAQQAQQRVSQMALAQTNSQMLLGGNAPGANVDPNTLALGLGAGGVASTPAAVSGAAPVFSQPGAMPADTGEDYDALIAKYISDEELLERIYIEKYEPKGMVRRTFFKSKDLQARELEKEKKRIIERYKTPMPMDEAIMSETQTGAAPSMSAPSSVPNETVDEPPCGTFVLTFDPDAPLESVEEEPLPGDLSPEEQRLRELERRATVLDRELAELKIRLDNVNSEYDKNKSLEEELREKIAKAEADDEQFKNDIEKLEFNLASAKPKEKERINRDIKVKEEQRTRNSDNLAKLRADLDSLLGNGLTLNTILEKHTSMRDERVTERESITEKITKAQGDFNAYQERLEKVRLQQELQSKLGELTPLLVEVNNSDYELRDIDDEVARMEKQRDDLKSEVASVKTQILGANDFDVISELNSKIADLNTQLSDLEKEFTKRTKRKSELTLAFNGQRRKANDYCIKNDLPLEEVIAAEDAVLGDIEFARLREVRETARSEAEIAVANAQAVYDDLSASSADVTMVAMEVAATIKDLEDEIADTQRELDEINAKMEEAGEDEKLILMVDQGEKSDKITELEEQLKQANVDGTKRKMEAQAEYDTKLEEAHVALDEANAAFGDATNDCDALDTINPLDLIVTGSGVISKDYKKYEAENLKKQLERSKNEIEQARLAAEQAQAQADQAREEATRATEEAKAEAERKAAEAAEAAEAAKQEAEERARAEVEAAEKARLEAEEAAERARQEAAEEAERVRLEAEEEKERTRREAAEETERARQEAAEEAERVRLAAEEEKERARIEAEEAAAEKARQEAEAAEEAERVRLEAEETKRKAEEELEEMRRKAEEEAEARRQEEEARKQEEEARRQEEEAKRLEEENKRKEEEERIKAEAERAEVVARKVADRKNKIIALREKIKDIKSSDEAKNLREELYSTQLSYDEDERGSTELMDFYNKTMDDIQHAGEIADLKAENAKKPKRVVRKVTERVNRKPKRRPGSASGKRRPSSASAAGKRRPSSGGKPRPAGARPHSGARPRPSGSRPRPR